MMPRWGRSRRAPRIEGDKPAKQKFRPYPLGSCQLDSAEGRTEEGTHYVFVAIDRVCTFVYAALHAEASQGGAAQVLCHLIAAVPDKIHTVLTDNGLQCTTRQRAQDACPHLFARVCQEQGSAHRLTTTHHPWTNGQGERMNRPCKDATVRKYDDQPHQHFTEPLQAFRMAYHFAKRLKTLNGLTPDEDIAQCWHKEPERVTLHPYHHTLGLNT